MLERTEDVSRAPSDSTFASMSPPTLSGSAPGRTSSSESMSAELLEWLASVADDPYAFALGAFPWGQEGTVLAKFPNGPMDWQRDVMEGSRDGLLTVDEAIQFATATGHGVGKPALDSLLV